MKTTLVILGPTSALLTIDRTRIQLGASVITPGDVDALVIHRPCIEEMAALPAYIRRCTRNPKFTLFAPDMDRVEGLLAKDTVCCSMNNGSALQIGLATYANLTQVDTGEGAPDVAICTAPGKRVYLQSASWMRPHDALSVQVFSWDPEGEFNDTIEEMLAANLDAAAIVDEEEKRRQAIHAQAEADVKAGKKVVAADLPGPLVTRLLWAPYQPTVTQAHHVAFTQMSMPFDVMKKVARQYGSGTIVTDDNIGREFVL